MNDERLERQIRAALERDARPLPPSLRARVSAIPDEFPRRHRLPRLTQLFTAAAAVAALVVLAAAALVLVGLHNATVGPAASPSSSAPATAPAVVAPASPTVSPATGWTAVSSPALAGVSLTDIVPVEGGFLALGTTSSPVAEHVLISANGRDWTRESPIITPPGPAGIAAVTPAGSGLIGVGSTGYSCSTGKAAVFTSSDGMVWAAVNLPAPATGQSYAADMIVAGPAGYVVLGGYEGCVGGSGTRGSAAPLNTPLLWRSTDGQHWTFVRFPETNVNIVTLAAGGPGFLLGGDRHVGSQLDAAIWTSRDGVTWTASNPLPDNQGTGTGGPMQVNAIAAGPDRILAASGRTGYQRQGRIWSSQDGVTWQKVANLSAQDPRAYSLAWTPAGFVMAALGGDTPGEYSLVIRSSPDGASWTTLFSLPPADSAVSGIASDGDAIVIVGTSGQNGLVVTGSVGAAPTRGSTGTACTTKELHISIVDSGAGLGTVGAWLRFANTSATTCTLHGWPTLVAVTAAGAETTARDTQGPGGAGIWFPGISGVPTVTLRPAEDTFAAYSGGDNPVGSASTCPAPYHILRVAPPGSDTFVSLSAYNAAYGQDQPACVGIAVSQIVPASAVTELLPLHP
jgi:hypothetical protein